MPAARSLIATAGAALALAVAGCGGGGSDKPLSHQDLAAKANAACAAASASIQKVPAATSMDGLGAYAGRIEAIGETLHGDLAKLTASAGDRAAFERYVGALRTANRALASMKTAAGKNDQGGVRTATSTIAGADVGALAARAGFATCATATTIPGS